MGCPQNLLYGRGQKVNTAAKALPISVAWPDPGRCGYAWAAVLTFSPCPFTIFCGQPIVFGLSQGIICPFVEFQYLQDYSCTAHINLPKVSQNQFTSHGFGKRLDGGLK